MCTPVVLHLSETNCETPWRLGSQFMQTVSPRSVFEIKLFKVKILSLMPRPICDAQYRCTAFSLPPLLVLVNFIFPRVHFDTAPVEGCEPAALRRAWAYTARESFQNAIAQLRVMWFTDLGSASCSKCNTLWLHPILVC